MAASVRMADKKPTSQERRVRFSSIDKPEVIGDDACCMSLSQKECKSIWFSSSELSDISERENQLAIDARMHGLDTKICIRGVEGKFSRRARLETHFRIAAVRSVVLREQDLQRSNNTFDPLKIRHRSLQATKESRRAALKSAEQDAKEARDGSFRKRKGSRECRSLDLKRQGSYKKILVDQERKTITVSF